MADSRALLSVGVDVGTTTTQIIFSRLNLQDVSRAGQIPRINITDRKVIYQSPIVFTPLIDTETIDADKLNQIVRSEYVNAGVDPSQVETGAVIITGETAKKKNADEILRALQQAGEDGMARTALRDLFGRHKSADRIGAALTLLALNELGCRGGRYALSSESALDTAVADQALKGREFIA